MLASMMNAKRMLSACLVLGLGVFVGVASEVTDSVPYMPVDQSWLSVGTQLITGLINSVVVWFAVPFMLGYLLCRSWRQSAIAGGGFMVAAILSYSVYSSLTPSEIDIEVGAMSVLGTMLEMLAIAVVGGVIGGAAGFLAQKRTSILLVLVLMVAAELARRGMFSWQSTITASENIIFIIGAIGVVVYVILDERRRRSSWSPRNARSNSTPPTS